MPINLDHVGLNTLIQEPVDQEQNTIGYKKRKALRMPSTTDSITGIITGDVQSTYPSSGYLSVSFWVKLDQGYGYNSYKYILEAYDNSNNNTFFIWFLNDELTIQTYNASGGYRRHATSTLTNLTSWNHFVVIIDTDDLTTIPVVYLNGDLLSALSNTLGSQSGAMNAIAGQLSLMGSYDPSTYYELQGSLQEFAFYNKQLSQDEVNEIYEAYDLTKTSLNSNIIDYWKLGEEQEFDNFSEGQRVTDGLTFDATKGSTSLTIDENIFISSGYISPFSYKNSQIASIPSGSYLAALNIHRNGPYGWPIFKQTRIGQNPLTRYQNRNSIFTYVTEIGDVKLLKQDGKLIDTIRERRSDLRQIIEAPVVSNYKPLTLIGSTEVESTRGGLLSKERIEIKATFANETTYFADDQATREHGVDLETVEDYEDFVDLYLDGGLDSDDSPFDEFEMLRFDQTIFPAPGNMYLNQVRSREEFVNKFWRDNRSDRLLLNHDFGFGFTFPSASMWPLDAPEVAGPTVYGTTDVITVNTSSVALGQNGFGELKSDLTSRYLGSTMTNDFKDIPTLPQYAYSNYFWTISSGSFNKHGIPMPNDLPITGGKGQNSVIKWQAPEMSGKTPFYDSYEKYGQLIKKLGNNYSLIPEFKISDHLEDILKYDNNIDSYTNPIFTLTGSEESDSNDSNFYKIYSNTDFLKNFKIIQEDNKGFVDPLNLKLRCKAVKKLLPYENFYPVQQTVELAKTFKEQYSELTSMTLDTISNATDSENSGSIMAVFDNLFSPGILYNTIKSGIAVDYIADHGSNNDGETFSMYTGLSNPNFGSPYEVSGEIDKYVGSSSDTDGYVKRLFNKRIPFESIITPAKELSDIVIPFGDTTLLEKASILNQEKRNYSLKVNNFLSEVADFFLKNKNYTSITSLPEGDPNFGNAISGSVYKMRVKMYRTVTGSKPELEENNYAYSYPQDSGSISETFTMYSNPSHFGKPFMTDFHNTEYPDYEFKIWKSYQKEELVEVYPTNTTNNFDPDGSSNPTNYIKYSGSYYPIGNNSYEGQNFPYTPPYYHGEAWAEFTFKAKETKKYTLNEIMNEVSIEFLRFYDKSKEYSDDLVGSIVGNNVITINGGYSGNDDIHSIRFVCNRGEALIPGSTAAAETMSIVFKTDKNPSSATDGTISVRYDSSSPSNTAQHVVDAINGVTDSTNIHYASSGLVLEGTGFPGITATRDGANISIETTYLNTEKIEQSSTRPKIIISNVPGGGSSPTGNVATINTQTLQFTASITQHHALINEYAMQLPSSVNLLSKGILTEDVGITSNISDQYRWIIQSKFETPHLNFNHLSFDDIERTYNTSSFAIGMWHQYGRIPESDEGIYLQVTKTPDNWINGPLGGDSSLTGSLVDLCGFSTEPVKMGQIKESKVIKEAVVAVPFLEREGERKFFTLDPKDIKHALSEETQNLVGQTVIDQVQRMQEYIFPPSMDFIRNEDIEPFAMYIFEFSHTLSKQDLADIWQNLSPDIGTSHEVAEATISHELLAHELLGDGAKLKFTNTLELDKKQRIKEIPSDIRWMVFKVKKRAASNYFEKIFERNESNLGDKTKLSELSATSTGANLGVQYNWPYDFFSLVELVKIDAQIDFAVPDDTQDTLEIKPRKKVKQVDTTPTENEAVINNALFGTGAPLTSPAQTGPQEPVEPNPLGNVTRRRKK